ncbi:MAG: hypothetical protein ACR2JB_23075 [Bryobacteraceae bacterium]
MQVVTIPFDYEELSPSEQAGIVPICIKATDEEGNPIDWGWFEAASRVQEPLRALARSLLDDVWRASEITEAAVHNLWNRHGHRLGLQPSRRVYAAAKWEARDRKAGSWQSRRRVLRAFEDLEEVVRKRVLIDPANYGRVYEDELYFEELRKQLEAQGLGDVSEMLKLVRNGCTWLEIGTQLGKEPDTARIRFRRWTTKIFSRAGTRNSPNSF